MKREHEFHAHSAPAEADATSPLQALLQREASAVPTAPRVDQAAQPPAGAVVLGQLLEAQAGLPPRVSWPLGPVAGAAAHSLVPLRPQDAGAQVALSLGGSLGQPLILGLVWNPAQAPEAAPSQVASGSRQLELSAEEELTLRCGKASLTLTADGQVLLHGSYIGSHATGTQRIKGAAVRIN
jgi:hypothetical protein